MLLDTPQHDFSFWPKRVCSCFTACSGPGTNSPDKVSLWLSQICLLGVILCITLCCQPHLQPGELTAPAGSMFSPREKAQVRREGASKQPKLGVLGDGWRCVPFSHTCRQCPLVLLPFGQMLNDEKNGEQSSELMAQTDGYKPLSSASTLGMGWPWLLFSLEELHGWGPWWPEVRRNWATVER